MNEFSKPFGGKIYICAATKEQRDAAIRAAAKLIRETTCPFLRRG